MFLRCGAAQQKREVKTWRSSPPGVGWGVAGQNSIVAPFRRALAPHSRFDDSVPFRRTTAIVQAILVGGITHAAGRVNCSFPASGCNPGLLLRAPAAMVGTARQDRARHARDAEPRYWRGRGVHGPCVPGGRDCRASAGPPHPFRPANSGTQSRRCSQW